MMTKELVDAEFVAGFLYDHREELMEADCEELLNCDLTSDEEELSQVLARTTFSFTAGHAFLLLSEEQMSALFELWLEDDHEKIGTLWDMGFMALCIFMAKKLVGRATVESHSVH